MVFTDTRNNVLQVTRNRMEYIWVRSLCHEELQLPFGACILKKQHKKVKVRDDAGNEMYVSVKDILKPMHPTCVRDVDDMILMDDLQEYSILRNLQLRYNKNIIYTYIGDILIAVNPYRTLFACDAEHNIQRYRNRRLGELPPHLFAIGDVSYQNMMVKKKKQCIIINGESGAGKTYAAGVLLRYYAAITRRHTSVEDQILESNFILEAFGNAKTIRNDNSSRFGKYIFINFDEEGNIEQAEIKQFLLEKSRVVTQCKGESNYHVFYLMLGGLSKKEQQLLGLKEASSYSYLLEGKIHSSDSETKTTAFRRLYKGLKILNFSNDEIWKIFELLAAILHFGNIKYNVKILSDAEAVEVKDSEELRFISSIMGVSIDCLILCLTKRTISTHLDSILKTLSKQEALSSRDAFVKAIYGNLFSFIVSKINETVRRRKTDVSYYVGILDIFGFEILKSNGFEQFCINLANEALQQFFIRHTFKLEEMIYLDEGISWKSISIVDNNDVVDLLILKPLSILNIMNDESKLSTTSETFLSKLIENHGENEHFLRPKFNNIQAFGIRHFAGVVLYDVQDFLEKNRDAYSSDYKNLIRSSENMLLKNIFSRDFEDFSTGSQSKKRMQTSSAKFKNSLDSLLLELNQCHPFFVRCIIPNESKTPNLFDRKLCCSQLRYLGVWETSKIRKLGYSIRYTYKEFVERYGLLKSDVERANSPSEASITDDKHFPRLELRNRTQSICDMVIKSGIHHQLGQTKIFLKNSQYLLLEKERELFLSRVLVLQKAARKWLCRKRYLALRAGAITIQKCWRAKKCRENYKTMRHGLLRLQSLLRSRLRRSFYVHLKEFIIRLQALCKGYVCRKKFQENLMKKFANAKIEAGLERGDWDVQAFALNSHFENEIVKATAREHFDIQPNGKSAKRGAFLLQIGVPDSFVAVSSFVDESFKFLDQMEQECERMDGLLARNVPVNKKILRFRRRLQR